MDMIVHDMYWQKNKYKYLPNIYSTQNTSKEKHIYKKCLLYGGLRAITKLSYMFVWSFCFPLVAKKYNKKDQKYNKKIKDYRQKISAITKLELQFY
jgi:hypothetical protein